jgi:hypothetical protein
VEEYIAFARIQAVRSGDKCEMSIGPPSSSEPFPNLASFESSLLLREHFSAVDNFLAGKQDWRSWVWFLRVPSKDHNGTCIDVKLISAPITITINVQANGGPIDVQANDRFLRIATSAFEKRQLVVLKVNMEESKKEINDEANREATKERKPSFKLTGVELVLES